MTDQRALKYRGTVGDSVPMKGGFSMTFDLSGPPTLTRQLRAKNLLLGLSRFQVFGNGRRVVSSESEPGQTIQVVFDHASVEGTFDGKPFRFEFDLDAPPEGLKENPLQQICWNLGMGGRRYTLGPQGEYLVGDLKGDAHGEAMALAIDGPVRLPDAAVAVGQEWTTEWVGALRQQKSDGVFHFRQSAKLEQIEDAGSRAHITFATSGPLQMSPDRNAAGEETLLDAKGSIVLDLAAGLPAIIESSGTITTQLKGAGMKMVRAIASKYETA